MKSLAGRSAVGVGGISVEPCSRVPDTIQLSFNFGLGFVIVSCHLLLPNGCPQRNSYKPS